MNGFKSFLTSKTIWGVIIMLVAQFLPNVIAMDEQAMVVDEVVTAAGALLAVIGRFTAKKQVTLTGAPKPGF